MRKKHILLCGERGVGKSTLIQRLLAQSTRPVYGFLTKRMAADATGFHPIYIHPAGAQALISGEENRIGVCDSKTHHVETEVFDTLGAAYIRQAKPGGIIVMDELGFMEAKAAAFVRAVFDALDGEIPVIAAVKARYDVPFLNEVRAHPNAALYQLDQDNRDALTVALLLMVQNGCFGA